MKLPPMTLSFQSAGAYAGRTGPLGYTTASYRTAAMAGVAPQGIFDDILGTVTGFLPNVACFAKCGTQALGCMHCGTNLGCWASCAGPVAMDCIQKCI